MVFWIPKLSDWTMQGADLANRLLDLDLFDAEAVGALPSVPGYGSRTTTYYPNI